MKRSALTRLQNSDVFYAPKSLGLKTVTPAEIHHVRRYGNVRLASPCLPLCPEHHRGNSGLHGLGTKVLKKNGELPMRGLLERVDQRLGKENA
jgi:hypothetical protein